MPPTFWCPFSLPGIYFTRNKSNRPLDKEKERKKRPGTSRKHANRGGGGGGGGSGGGEIQQHFSLPPMPGPGMGTLYQLFSYIVSLSYSLVSFLDGVLRSVTRPTEMSPKIFALKSFRPLPCATSPLPGMPPPMAHLPAGMNGLPMPPPGMGPMHSDPSSLPNLPGLPPHSLQLPPPPGTPFHTNFLGRSTLLLLQSHQAA